MSVIASLFDFPYRSKDIYECIKDTETSLRHLISKVMNQQFGSEWLYDSQRGFAAKDLEEVRKRKKHETADSSSNNLLDYCFFPELKVLILNNWDVFEPIFCDRNKFSIYMDELNTCRKSVAHFRGISINKKYLYLGICGEILLWIHSWKIGHRYKVKGYSVDFRFQITSISKDDKNEHARAANLAEKWIERIEAGSTKLEGFKTNSIFPDRLAKVVQFAEGDLLITEPYTRPNYYGYISSVSIHTESKDILDRLITTGNHPYWCINWILDQNLERPGDDKQVSFVNYHGTIRVILRQFDQSKSQVGLICDGDNSFLSAHRYFDPSVVLSMYDGRMDLNEFLFLIDKSFS